VNKAKRFRITMFYQNRNVGEQIVDITSKFMIDVSYAEAPELKEGIESSLKIRVKNQSQTPSDAGLKLSFNSDPEKLEMRRTEAQIGILNPGEERIIEFPVIARETGAEIRVPLVFLASLGTGRRVGLIDEERRIPLINDYRIQVAPTVNGLRNEGITRIEYTIQNISSRMLMKGLQLKVKVMDDTANNFVVIGPNPQYLMPMIRGQSIGFVIPVLVKSNNAGGVLELEVQEDGHGVVISRVSF